MPKKEKKEKKNRKKKKQCNIMRPQSFIESATQQESTWEIHKRGKRVLTYREIWGK